MTKEQSGVNLKYSLVLYHKWSAHANIIGTLVWTLASDILTMRNCNSEALTTNNLLHDVILTSQH